MALSSISFLEADFPLPFRFTSRLPFSTEDKTQLPWLSEPDRFYAVEKELRKGGRSIAYKGYVLNADGTKWPNSPDIVLKVPNIDWPQFTSDQIRDFLNRLSDEGGREWPLTRKRLQGCVYANPIFDFDVAQVPYLGELMPFPVTAQLYLTEAVSLDEFLLNTGQRTKPYISVRGAPQDHWNGMPDPNQWIVLARAIATGLADIHQRRIVHGDIWPPTIYLRLIPDQPPQPIFIDFGDAFPIEPQGHSQEQRDHAYRAPERRDSESIVTKQCDVYSLGKLLLHLAVGQEPILQRSCRGHERRDLIRQIFLKHNPGIVASNPFIMDVICKCVSFDPVDRPNALDVVRALNSYVDVHSYQSKRISVPDKLDALKRTWDTLDAELQTKNLTIAPSLQELITSRMDEIEEMISGLSNEVVILTDTRERLILAMVGLFQRLVNGDRFLSITSPRMWQGSALGLDGRYFTATQLAAARGASIQRTFIFSIEEVGEEWARELAASLNELARDGSNLQALALSNSIAIEIRRFSALKHENKSRDLPERFQKEARLRLQLVVKSYLDASRGICRGAFDQAEVFTTSAGCKGIYVGIHPVCTLSALRTLKAAHPIAVFYYGSENLSDRYLLMLTDCVARDSIDGQDDSTGIEEVLQTSKPELRGMTVFKSVLGIPEDRVKKIEQIFRQSVSIGPWLELHPLLLK